MVLMCNSPVITNTTELRKYELELDMQIKQFDSKTVQISKQTHE